MCSSDLLESGDGQGVEITMYGEVVESVPIDWWTGEPIDGLFIVLSEFLEDIKGIDGKDVTVRINSVGGDLEAGVAIYNRLKEIGNVTTIVDGLAASAASIIAQAGRTRKVYPSSQMMVHSASVLVWDWIDIGKVKEIGDMLESANKQVTAVYAQSSGQSETKIRHMVESTTWMVGKEIVDAGFADEIIDGKEVKVSVSADHRLVLCNGIPMAARRIMAVPRNAMEAPGIAPVAINQSEKEVEVMTVEELRNQYPEAVTQIEEAARASVDVEAARAEAAAGERKRIEDIDSIEASIKDKELVRSAKYGDKPMDARELALLAMQKQASEERDAREAFLAESARDARESNAESVIATPAGGEDDDARDIAIAVKAFNATKGGKA